MSGIPGILFLILVIWAIWDMPYPKNENGTFEPVYLNDPDRMGFRTDAGTFVINKTQKILNMVLNDDLNQVIPLDAIEGIKFQYEVEYRRCLTVLRLRHKKLEWYRIHFVVREQPDMLVFSLGEYSNRDLLSQTIRMVRKLRGTTLDGNDFSRAVLNEIMVVFEQGGYPLKLK